MCPPVKRAHPSQVSTHQCKTTGMVTGETCTVTCTEGHHITFNCSSINEYDQSVTEKELMCGNNGEYFPHESCIECWRKW